MPEPERFGPSGPSGGAEIPGWPVRAKRTDQSRGTGGSRMTVRSRRQHIAEAAKNLRETGPSGNTGRAEQIERADGTDESKRRGPANTTRRSKLTPRTTFVQSTKSLQINRTVPMKRTLRTDKTTEKNQEDRSSTQSGILKKPKPKSPTYSTKLMYLVPTSTQDARREDDLDTSWIPGHRLIPRESPVHNQEIRHLGTVQEMRLIP